MMRVLCVTILGLCCALAVAQEPPKPPSTGLDKQIATLRVARALKLRQDQVDQLKPWLQQVQDARDKQKQTLDAIAVWGIPAIINVDRALIADRKPAAADVNSADRAAREQRAAFAETEKVVDAAVDTAFKVLDPSQARLVETLAQQQNRNRNAERYAGAASLADYITGYASAMRRLLPEEYETLRTAMAMRLAARLVPPGDRRYNDAVNGVLRVLDGVRQMTDADYSQRAEGLSQQVARALRLPEQDTGAKQPISYAAFVDFISSEGALEALAAYKPAPPLEVAP